MDWKQLFDTVGPMLRQQLSQLPPGAQQALRETAVYITQDGNFITLDIRFNEENPEAEKARDVLLKSLMDAIPQVVKLFGCRSLVKIEKREE